jgi:hypothetical protein
MGKSPGATVALFSIAVVNMSDVSIASLCKMMEKAGGCQEGSDKLSHELYKNEQCFYDKSCEI